MFTVWHDALGFANHLIEQTSLGSFPVELRRLPKSDASDPATFHAVPQRIKDILYLDAPDVIVTIGAEPIFSLEISEEAGTGHNAFQRFGRIAAAVENDVPALYIYPDAVIVTRDGKHGWDRLNRTILRALESVMQIHNVPALLFRYPSDFTTHAGDAAKAPNRFPHKGLHKVQTKHGHVPDPASGEMRALFEVVNRCVDLTTRMGAVDGRRALVRQPMVRQRRAWMAEQYNMLAGDSPLTATKEVPSNVVLALLARFHGCAYAGSPLIGARPTTVIYDVDAKFRGDPYPGALAALDYMLCRDGPTFEDRAKNLVLAWGRTTIDGGTMRVDGRASVSDFVEAIQVSERQNLLSRNYAELRDAAIPRYYMQVRQGSRYTKAKHIRMYAYFADAILFTDGALWRDG